MFHVKHCQTIREILAGLGSLVQIVVGLDKLMTWIRIESILCFAARGAGYGYVAIARKPQTAL
jgi:hypothetical protein